MHSGTYNGRETPLGAKNSTLGKHWFKERNDAANKESRQRRLIVEHLHCVTHEKSLFLIHPLQTHTESQTHRHTCTKN